MKKNPGTFKFHSISYSLIFFLFMLGSVVLSSCKKEEPAPVPKDYLVSFDKLNHYGASFIKILFRSSNDEYPGIDSLENGVAYGVELYSITYKTHFKGTAVTASGLVCVPLSSEKFPILSFQNGTNTYKLNAPSKDPTDPLYFLIEMMASHGYVVVIPDYLGFGASEDMIHPYFDKASTTDAVSDMILAAHELLNDESVDAESNGKHFLMGYSQGGWATLAELKKAEDSYQGKINVVAASCGAGAYDISAMSEYVLAQQVYPGPLYLPYFIYPKITSGDIDQPLTTFFEEPYASAIPGLFNGNFTNAEVDESLTDSISSLMTDELLLNLNTGAEFASLRTAMSTNSVQAWNTSSLLRFYHGTADMNVPPDQSAVIYNHFMALGLSSSRISLIPIPGATHDSGLIPWGISTIEWFDSLKE
jgi:pimeloyl-ACP methyl ester carboxylesterase